MKARMDTSPAAVADTAVSVVCSRQVTCLDSRGHVLPQQRSRA